MLKQRTLKKSISATGVGLHTGDKVKMTLLPSPKLALGVQPLLEEEEPLDGSMAGAGAAAAGASVLTVVFFFLVAAKVG